MTLQEWLFPDGIFNQRRLTAKSISLRYPDLYETFKKYDSISEGVYCYLNDIKETPICSNEDCHNKVKYKNFTSGYRKFCSNACLNKSNSENKNFGKIISNARKKKYDNDYFEQKYGHKKVGDKFLVNGVLIDRNKLLRLNDFKIPDNKTAFIENWKDIRFKTTEKWLKTYMPNVYEEIEAISNKDVSFQQKKFMYINDLSGAPLCPICNENERTFNSSTFNFNLTCCSTNCLKSNSGLEKEIFDFIRGIYDKEIKTNFRIDNKEIDIFLPDLNTGFEVNGVYWHSEFFKDKNYHFDKKCFFNSKNIKLVYVWEDDWHNNSKLIKSMIANKLGLSERIYARKCKISKIKYAEAKSFFQENHIRGFAVSKCNYGLIYNDKLIACMSFGKSRYDKDGWEIIRFANLSGITVVGGFSKLLKYGLNENKIQKLISYADNDISDGNVYIKTGFKNLGFTEPGFCWFKDGIRYSRQSLWKYTAEICDKDNYLRELGYYKIWNSGNMKFVFDNLKPDLTGPII